LEHSKFDRFDSMGQKLVTPSTYHCSRITNHMPLRPQHRSKRGPILPEQEQLENRDNNCGTKSFRCQESMKDQHVHNDCAQNHQAKWGEASDEQKQAAKKLKTANEIDVTTGKKDF